MPQDQKPSIVKSRWVQLIVGIVGMVAIANLQYGWTLFVGPINQKFGWGTPAIQVAFTLFVLAETWLVPFEAYFVDRYGPRVIVAVGGSSLGLLGSSTQVLIHSRSYMPVALLVALVRASCTARRAALRSNGFLIVAAWRRGSRPRDLAPAQR